jgi:hypothetical protein
MKIYIHTLLNDAEKQLLINALSPEKGYQVSFGDTCYPKIVKKPSWKQAYVWAMYP